MQGGIGVAVAQQALVVGDDDPAQHQVPACGQAVDVIAGAHAQGAGNKLLCQHHVLRMGDFQVPGFPLNQGDLPAQALHQAGIIGGGIRVLPVGLLEQGGLKALGGLHLVQALPGHGAGAA